MKNLMKSRSRNIIITTQINKIMFTGIIVGTGKVTKLDQRTKNRSAIRMTVDLGKYTKGLKIGQSVAINGVCLSATKISNNKCVFEMIDETTK